MSETGTSFKTYTRLYKEQWRQLMKAHEGRHMPLRHYHSSVATTWTISHAAVRARNQAAANLLLLWAHLNNKDLWYNLMAAAPLKSTVVAEQAAKWLGDIAKLELEFTEAIRVLRSFSLIEESEGQLGYTMHPVVHQWALYAQDSRQQDDLSRLALMLVGLAVPGDDEEKYWETQARLLAHAENCRKSITKEKMKELGATDLPSEQEEESMRTLLWAAHNLGDLYNDQGKLDIAEDVYTHALEGKRKALGGDDMSTVSTVNNLGNLYRDQGKFKKAEELYMQALESTRRGPGEEHMSTLLILNNLGNLYNDQENLDKAEEMYAQALKGKIKMLGEAHTSTLTTINNLGNLFRYQGRLDKAEEMYLQALNGYQRALGEGHTSTLDIVDNLGLLYSNQGKLDKAEKMYKQALEGRTQVLGEGHISTLATVHNLGLFYGSQGEWSRAEEMFVRALQGYNRAVGLESVSTYVPALNTLWALGLLHDSLAHVGEAREWYLKALLGMEKVFGEAHARCQLLRDNLAALDSTDMGGDVECNAVPQERVHCHGETTSPQSRLNPISRRQRVLQMLGWLQDARC